MYTMDDIKGQITFITFTGREIVFDIMDDDKLICRTYNFGKVIDRIFIKPNLLMFFTDNQYIDLDIIRRKNNTVKDYVMRVACDQELLDGLIQKGSLRYSTDMSYLYELYGDAAYDKSYNTRAFKHIKDDSKILAKQKRGMFN